MPIYMDIHENVEGLTATAVTGARQKGKASKRKVVMYAIPVDEKINRVGQSFLAALAEQDFEQLETLFAPQVRFRALLPPRTCEEHTATAAAGWLQRWFGGADAIQVLQAAADPVFDRLHLHYRLRTHDAANGWRVIEQQAYGEVRDGRIVDLWLLCSGFRLDQENQNP